MGHARVAFVVVEVRRPRCSISSRTGSPSCSGGGGVWLPRRPQSSARQPPPPVVPEASRSPATMPTTDLSSRSEASLIGPWLRQDHQRSRIDRRGRLHLWGSTRPGIAALTRIPRLPSSSDAIRVRLTAWHPRPQLADLPRHGRSVGQRGLLLPERFGLPHGNRRPRTSGSVSGTAPLSWSVSPA